MVSINGSSNGNGAIADLPLNQTESESTASALVESGGKLPYGFQVSTGKLLDVVVALSPQGSTLDAKKRKKFRQTLNQKLYTRTRPGFYLEIREDFHIAYAGQPQGAGTQHHWRIFCQDQLKPQIETILAGTALTSTPPHQAAENGGNYTCEWGGLYLRSVAEVKIAEALDQAGVLFFANVRGRVGLQETLVSNAQLSGRVELDFLVVQQGKSVILEVDGQHHLGAGQSIRDYARDRVLLKSGLPTVRFTAQDCLHQPQAVVAEVLSILKAHG